MVATGSSDTRTAGAATELGAFGYLIKPFDQNQLLITVENALHRRQLEIGERRRQDELEGMVDDRSRQLRRTVSELRESRQETIEKLIRALQMRDGATGAHVERIGQLAEALSRWVGIDPERAGSIGLAARMHEIGKIGVPDRVLLEPGPLDPDERREMERHPAIGREILLNSKTELLRLATTIAGTHHERFDGNGYPDGLAGEGIPWRAGSPRSPMSSMPCTRSAPIGLRCRLPRRWRSWRRVGGPVRPGDPRGLPLALLGGDSNHRPRLSGAPRNRS